jgi:hypothetical protein
VSDAERGHLRQVVEVEVTPGEFLVDLVVLCEIRESSPCPSESR